MVQVSTNYPQHKLHKCTCLLFDVSSMYGGYIHDTHADHQVMGDLYHIIVENEKQAR